jgi:FkbM family methyltransferase
VALQTWWSGRRYEAPTPQVLRRWLREADQFFDIGANYGWFSYLALSSSTAEVHAFEPNGGLVQQMLATKSANKLARFHPHQLGLSNEATELHLRVQESHTGYSTFGPHPDLRNNNTAVRVVPFDQWRAEVGMDLPGRPSWVAKIDVEGFETKVLQGMSESLCAQAFIGLAVELNSFTLDFCGTSTAEVVALLADSGYRMVPEPGEDRILNRFFVPVERH